MEPKGPTIKLRIGSSFVDTYQFMQVQIPTSLFGAVKVPTAEGSHPFATGKDWLTENRPTVADVVYELDAKDTLENGAGWKEKAMTELFPEQKSVVPAIFRSFF